jgi:SAM-dependent methyltransferase
MMDYKYIQELREYELSKVIPLMNAKSDVLEIGAGMGSQSRTLSNMGFNVKAIDVQDSNYLDEQVWPVIIYDGNRIPFDDDSFDIIFSSSVLEHISGLVSFQNEIKRALRPDGIVVHVLPNFPWRLWTSLTYYPYRIKQVIKHFLFKEKIEVPDKISQSAGTGKLAGILRKIIPDRHGERGNIFSEHYLFSSVAWKRFFNKAGWEVYTVYPVGLFYTGNSIFGNIINIRKREIVSKILGSGASVYAMKIK